MNPRIYLDHAATTPARPEVLEAMLPFLGGTFGNPSSLHAEGRAAREAVEDARERIGSILKVHPREIFFTSGGTEANNLALRGVALAARPGSRILAGATEHPSVLRPLELLGAEGFETARIPVDADGRVRGESLDRTLAGRALLVSVMHANNEVGTVNDLPALSAASHARGALVHSDLVQSLGRIALEIPPLGADLATLSAHKIGGPKGTGALWIRKGIPCAPLVSGGGQEAARRPGTENVAGIAGFARALERAAAEMESRRARAAALGRLLRDRLRNIEGARINTPEGGAVPGIVNVSFPGVEGQAVVLGLDLEGIAVSTGAACNGEGVEASHVLLAMGRSKAEASGAVRFSIGAENTQADIETAARLTGEIAARLLKKA